MIRRPPRSTLSSSSAASDVYKRQVLSEHNRPRAPKADRGRNCESKYLAVRRPTGRAILPHAHPGALAHPVPFSPEEAFMRTLLCLVPVLVLALSVGASGQAPIQTDTFKTSAGDLQVSFIGHGTLMFRFGKLIVHVDPVSCLLYTSDAADEEDSV